VPPDRIRVAQVFPDSPASEGGLSRGDTLLAVDGRGVGDLIAAGAVDAAFGPGEEGVTRRVRYRTMSGEEREVEMTKRLVTIPTVTLTRVYDVGGRRVGYVFFRNFVRPSIAALSGAFAELARERATELVLDLRYNGGGLVNVAQHLGGLIGGRRTAGQLFAEFAHNDKNAHRNQRLTFPTVSGDLSLERLVVITTGASASASELIINALRPFIPVIVIGDNTYGKPVGQYSFNFCQKVLHPVAFSLKNARGESDFYDGFPPDCAAADDLDHQIGDPAEASLDQALTFVATGACRPTAEASRRRPARERMPHRSTGWQQLVGAY
jgi:C-terminal processing protease CtpA/Prc